MSLAMDSGNVGIRIWTGGTRRRQGRFREPVTVDGFIDVRRTVWTATTKTRRAAGTADLRASILRTADPQHGWKEKRRVDPRRNHDDDDKGANLLVSHDAGWQHGRSG